MTTNERTRRRVLYRIAMAFGRWRTALGFSPEEPVMLPTVKQRYHQLALSSHPDLGGDTEDMKVLNWAITEAKKELSA